MKRLIATLAFGLAATLSAHAAWPDKPVTMVVPFPAGGSTDVIARIVGAKLQEQTGVSFLVENKPGAAGAIGASFVKRAAPDGYTLLVSSLGPLVIAPHLIKSTPYDPARDFDYISVAVQAPNILAVPANSRFQTLQEVVAYLKTNPGKLTFASAGNGTSDHLTAELFWQQTGTIGTHVPYKGGAPAMNDLIGGQVDATFMNINTAMPQVRAGKIRALAITSTQRSPVLPSVPTMEEAGIKNLVVYSWQAVAAPRGLPADIRERLHKGIVAALNDPAVKNKLLEVGFEIVGNTPEQFTRFQAAESARWKLVIDTGKIAAD